MGDDKKIYELPLDQILPNRFQPRITFDDDQIYELSESIKLHGVFSPIIVRKLGDKYEIVAGERRYKASVLAGKTTIPAIISTANDDETMKIALLENVQRANLTPIEEAISYKKISDFENMSQEKLAKMLGKTQATVANKMRLLKLSEEVQEALLENKISERHARSLLKLKNESDQVKMLNKIINERLTVRKLDEEIDKYLKSNEGLETINISDDKLKIDLPDKQVNEIEVEDINMNEQNNFFNFPKIENENNSNFQNEEQKEILGEKSNIQNSKILNNIFDIPFEPITENTQNFESLNVNENVQNSENLNENVQNNSNVETLNPFGLQNDDDIDIIPIIDDDINNNNNIISDPLSDKSLESKNIELNSQNELVENVLDEVNNIPSAEIIDEEIDNSNLNESTNDLNINFEENIEPGNENIKLDAALNKFRQNVIDLKKQGYKIDIDEFDLETMYQLIIKIEK